LRCSAGRIPSRDRPIRAVTTVSDRIIPGIALANSPHAHESENPPEVDFGNSRHAARPRRRELDLRRTQAPEPGDLPAVRQRHPRRYGVAVFDGDGRITDQALFALLGFAAGLRVQIGVTDGHAVIVRTNPSGESVLTRRAMVLVPARVRRWCGFGPREQVLLVAVPHESALIIHGLEKLDQALPKPRALIAAMQPLGGPVPSTPPSAVRPERGAAAHTGGAASSGAGRGVLR
jgi:hypothetical protein